MEHIQLVEFSSLKRIPDKYNKRFKILDINYIKNYIDENQNVISEVLAGIAEDWYSTCATYWDEANGYFQKYEPFTRSKIGRPAVLVVFKDGTELSFLCYKEELNIFQKIVKNLLSLLK